MTGEVCMYDKFGFCKRENSCKKVHLKETCLLEECENKSRCHKRHPRPCKYTERGNCKYGDICRFDHRPPKYLRSLISRLDALEKENEKLLKVIEDQDKRIEKIAKRGQITNEEVTVDKIQKQIDEMEGKQKKAISEAIKKLARGIDEKNRWFNTTIEIVKDRVTHLESLEYQDDDEEEEEGCVELQETSEERDSECNEQAEENKLQTFIKKSLEIIDDMEKDVQKLRKNACQKDIREKFLLHWNKIENETKYLDKQMFWRHNGCIEAVNEMKAVLDETEKNGIKFDKDECQKTVTCFKSRLTKFTLN